MPKAKVKKPKKSVTGTRVGTEAPDGHTDTPTPPVNSEKEELQLLYQKLKDLGVNSISDLEVKISRLA